MSDGLAKIQTRAASVLVVEKEPTSRMSLTELLCDQGYQVVEAADSGSAITQISRNPDLKVVLSDLEMPSWSAIIEHARTNLPDSLILGMVCYGLLSNAFEAQRLGADGYLVKPLSFADVNQWIQRLLTGQSLNKP